MLGILFLESAQREYRKLPVSTRLRVNEALDMLRINPLSELIKIRRNAQRPNQYRLATARCKIVFSIQDERIIIRTIRADEPQTLMNYVLESSLY